LQTKTKKSEEKYTNFVYLRCAFIGLVDEYLGHALDGDGEGYDGVVGGRAAAGTAGGGLVAAARARRAEHRVTRLTEQQLLHTRLTALSLCLEFPIKIREKLIEVKYLEDLQS
jgi:hypothetical protein